MTDKELIQELRSKAEVEGAGSTRRLLELAARALERVQWISVKKCLPGMVAKHDDGECDDPYYVSNPVLAYDIVNREYSVVVFTKNSKEDETIYTVNLNGGSEMVTHWMSLPEPPEEVSGDA